MSDVNFPDPNAQTFQDYGTPMPQPQKRGNRTWLFACGGCLGLLALVCCCCIAATYFGSQQPVIPVTLWGAFISAENYDLAENFVCDGSQAARYTDELRSQGARFTDFSANQTNNNDPTATGTLETSTGIDAWSATFITAGEGSFPISECISEIRVTSSDS